MYCISLEQVVAAMPFFRSIELYRNSSSIHLIDEWPYLYYQRQLQWHILSNLLFLQNKKYSKEISWLHIYRWNVKYLQFDWLELHAYLLYFHCYHANISDNNKKDTNSLLSLNLMWAIVGEGSVSICIEKCGSFKRLKS